MTTSFTDELVIVVIDNHTKTYYLVIYNLAKLANARNLVIYDQDSTPDGRGCSPMVSSLSQII